MSLPDASRLSLNPGSALAERLRALDLTIATLRRLSLRGDDLWNPLTSTREADVRDDATAVAFRLLFCREEMPQEQAAAALGPELFDAALRCGLLIEPGANAVLAPFHLRIVQGLYLFSDYLQGGSEAVMGAGETTAVLYRASVPPGRITGALDLGCGAGTLTLLAASFADRAIGTDVNDRAIALARCNADVNGIRNAEFRIGDVYAPVRDERFDLIVSQPPYYPKTSGGDITYLHGGERGDEIAQRVLVGAPRHLSPEGRALIFASWPPNRDVPAFPGMHVLELETNRREIHGTRQSLTVIERNPEGRSWSSRREVPADRWGSVDRARIDPIIAVEQLLRYPDAQLLQSRFEPPPGSQWLSEGEQRLFRGGPDSLVGLVPIDDELYRFVRSIQTKAPGVEDVPLLRRALRTGLLELSLPD